MDFYENMEVINLGLYFNYSKNKPIWLNEWEEENDRVYSDVLELKDYQLKNRFSAFISCKENEINYIARIRKDRNVVTKKTRVFYEKVIKLERPIKFTEIFKHSSPQMNNSLRKMLENDISQITVNRWNAIISYLFDNDKKQHQLINDILKVNSKKADGKNNRIVITNHEKDAVGLSLRIAGINNQLNDIASWDIENTSTPDFLKNVSTAKLREDQLIINDFRIFNNWKLIDEYMNNVAVFSDGSNRVSIMNVNRTPIETTLGVDLFYYNHIHKNYIFVQYKRLTKNGEKHSFNIKSDSSFLKEMERMTKFEERFGKNTSLKTIDDYRLNKEMFYFKFCRDDQNIMTKDLSKGMYLTKSFMDIYINHFQNKSISYDKIDKYLNNTMFIEMVKTGLFGSTVEESGEITELINNIISSGKSVIIAVKNNNY